MIDENHPAVRRLLEKIVAEKIRIVLDEFGRRLLDGISAEPPLGSLVVPDPEDAIEYARFEGWLAGMKQGHQGLLQRLRHDVAAAIRATPVSEREEG